MKGLKTQFIYYVAFPAIVLGLCVFSYFLGFKRGALQNENSRLMEMALNTPNQADEKKRQDLTFYRNLRSDKPVDDLALEEKLAEEQVSEKASAPVHAVELKPGSSTKKPEALVQKKSPGNQDQPKKENMVRVQVSSFRDLGRAHEMVDELKNKGFPAFTENYQSWHRVYVGPYSTRDRADAVVKDLVSQGFSTGFVTQ